ncbi:cytochrome P450 [Actinoplanes sp. NBRC 103695]|uniref:cytochrome P450 n=1 Tax=Actinoplanes sp. NBRC 103695 TaxID=3032202 RepID=UPI0024A53BB3|nr:cytochrome P450 [Actinoplanes sp. NBRC 103695]GLZ01162.1 cytochrome P450 [Actinoplanes sp. NBRC 103695]
MTTRPAFPIPRRTPDHPPAEYREAGTMSRCPLSYGGDAWLVNGFQATREILASSDDFSADDTVDGFPAMPMASKHRTPGHFLTMDPPEHTRLRQLVSAQFTPGRVRRMIPAMRETVLDLVDRLIDTGPPADLIAGLAVPLNMAVASQMLGTPGSDAEFFLDVVRELQTFDASPARRKAAAGRMTQYLRRAIPEAADRGGDNLLGLLAVHLGTDEGFTLDDLVGVANLVIIAGSETTPALTGLTMFSLLRDPEQAALVREDPPRWAKAAVHEALRYWTLVQYGIARVAVKDVDVAGQRVRAGEAVVLNLPTANRDPAEFPDADTFDITRDMRPHLAFGHGIHRCLGAPVAVAQTELAVAEVMSRLPGLRPVVSEDQLAFRAEMLIHGLRALPVRW